tara:strand:+ start:944 stop:1711 length:768 start_codon:yes stop_codon:yes gene_type:complete
MAVGPKTQYLIAAYAREIKQDKQQREDIQKTLDGVKIFSGDHNNELVTVIEGCDEMIDRYQPAVEGLDDKINDVNNSINAVLQNILDTATAASDCSLVDSEPVLAGVDEDGDPAALSREIAYDQVQLHQWAFSGEDPFAKTITVLDGTNSGIGTYTGIATVLVGSYLEFVDGSDGNNCDTTQATIDAEYAKLPALRAERDAVIEHVNIIKEERARYELRKYGMTNSMEMIDDQIAKKEGLIEALEDPDYAEYIKE